MTYSPEQPPAVPPHPAGGYYPAPAYLPPPPKDLTAFGVLAFASAALTTAFTVANAVVVGRAVRHTGGSTYDELDWSVAVYALANILLLVTTIASWVTASLWLFRARRNAELLAPGRPHARSAGWAWGGWVCPVVQLWFPFQVVRDVHKAVSPLSLSPLVGAWWAALLVMQVSLRVDSRIESSATPDQAGSAQAVAVVVAVAAVVTLVLWGLVLRMVTREQHALMYGGAPVGRS